MLEPMSMRPPEENAASRAILDQIGRRMLKRRVDALKSLPSFPESILRINEMMFSDHSSKSLPEIAQVIEADPVMTARILRLINSAFYGVSGAVSSVNDALVMLGLDVVRGLLLSSSAMRLASDRQGVRGLREHSFGAAIAASALAKTIGSSYVEEASAAALMHDIGKLVLASQLGNEYDDVVAYALRNEIIIRDAEIKLLGVPHDVIGQWLVARWRLPEALAEPIIHHHHPEKANRFEETAAIVHVADLMIRGYGFGFPGDALIPLVSDRAWRLLGLNEATLGRAVQTMHRDLQAALVHANLYVFS